MDFVLPSWIFGEQSGVFADYPCFPCQYYYTIAPFSHCSYRTEKREKPRNIGWKKGFDFFFFFFFFFFMLQIFKFGLIRRLLSIMSYPEKKLHQWSKGILRIHHT